MHFLWFVFSLSLFFAAAPSGDSIRAIAAPDAGEHRARVEVVVTGERPAGKAVQGEIIARSADGEREEKVEFTELSSKVLELEPGLSWEIGIAAPGFWARPTTVIVGAEPLSVNLHIWPTGSVSGLLAYERGVEAPSVLAARFQPAGSQRDPAASSQPAGRAECNISDDSFSCEMPAGVFDLRVRAERCASAYFFDVHIKIDSKIDLGKVHLAKGASVVGWIATEDSAPIDAAKARVAIRPRRADSAGAARALRHSQLQTTITGVSTKGFYQFTGLAPGDYDLFAKQEGYTTAQATARVFADSEAELLEPLVLHRPRIAEGFIEPRTDPWGSPWAFQLWLIGPDSSAAPRLVAEGASGLDGTWRADGLPGGTHSLVVLGGKESRWHVQRFVLDSDSPPVFTEIGVIGVRGSVTMGDAGIAGKLVFGGRFGHVSIPMTADETGEFEGFLPNPGEWRVSFEGADLPVTRELERVAVEPGPDGGDAVVDILLPGGKVTGNALDDQGRVEGNALISAFVGPARELIQEDSDDGGFFEIVGLPEGPVVLKAAATDGRESREVTFHLEADAEHGPVTLILEPPAKIGGQVVSAGGPVPGAGIMGLPFGPVSFDFAALHISDGAGRFELEPPLGASGVSLLVFPFGYAMTMLRVNLPCAESISVAVDQTGGTLSLVVPKSSRPATAAPFLFRDGAWAPLGLLTSEWQGTRREVGADGASCYEFSQMAAGHYSLCLIPLPVDLLAIGSFGAQTGRCVGATLQPYGHGVLDLTGPSGGIGD